MSFADKVSEELCEIPVRQPCCRHALTAGLLLCARLNEQKEIEARYRREVTATLASAMIHETYAKIPESVMTGAHGHRYYDLRFSSKAALKMLRQIFAADSAPEDALHFGCEGCRSAFLRGIFLSCGTVNDPHKSFHLEFSFEEEAVRDFAKIFLTSLGYPPRGVTRPKTLGLYYKDGGAVEDLIALMGSQHTVFEIINDRIEREIRNNENRATNFVTSNIKKTVSASAKHLEAINLLLEKGRFDRLPMSLQETATLRYQNPNITLDELAAQHRPPISKSGLNHRLKKLLEEAEEIQRKESL